MTSQAGDNGLFKVTSLSLLTGYGTLPVHLFAAFILTLKLRFYGVL